MTQQQLAEFIQAHPFEFVCLALAVNAFGIMAIVALGKAIHRQK